MPERAAGKNLWKRFGGFKNSTYLCNPFRNIMRSFFKAVLWITGYLREKKCSIYLSFPLKEANSQDSNDTFDFLQWRVWSWLRMNASGRLNTCKSRGSIRVAIPEMATGARVRNAYATYPLQGDNTEKSVLIPHNIRRGIFSGWKLRWLWMGMRCISWLVR